MKRAYAYDFREKRMKEFIVANFDTLFPDYYFESTERRCNTGIIDILAGEKKSAIVGLLPGPYRFGRPVIIELKVDNRDPTPQLLRYAPCFENPILVGVTQRSLPIEWLHDDVQYYFLRECDNEFIGYAHPKKLWDRIKKKSAP